MSAHITLSPVARQELVMFFQLVTSFYVEAHDDGALVFTGWLGEMLTGEMYRVTLLTTA